MSKSNTSVQVGPGALGCLGILFVALKILGYISWPWLWVLAPFWAGLAFVALIIAVIFISALVVQLLK
jgi:hypothetical protein